MSKVTRCIYYTNTNRTRSLQYSTCVFRNVIHLDGEINLKTKFKKNIGGSTQALIKLVHN
jgi:hypothetical protein